MVANTWQNAHKEMPCEWNPLDHGWEVTDDRMKLLWFDGTSMPNDLIYNIASESDVDVVAVHQTVLMMSDRYTNT